MNPLTWLTGAGSILKSVESIAKESIDTIKETVEGTALLVKTLDPNGLMRRDISGKIIGLYIYYVISMSIMYFLMAMGWGDTAGLEKASDSFKELFFPITTMTGAIVTASFGVNGINSYKGK